MFSTTEVPRLDSSPFEGAGPVRLQAFNSPWGKGRVSM